MLALGLTAFLASARPLDAHDIPSRVAVMAFVKAEPGRLRIVLRAPLEAMRDINWPEKGLGYLDLTKASPMARDAAQLWIADYLQVYENGALIAGVKVAATRISIPSEKTFGSYDAALAATTGAPVPASVEIPWKQALIDVVLDYPITSDS